MNRILDFRVRTTLKRGPAANLSGPFLVSYTEFTPHTLRDLPAIYLAAERLRDACASLEGAVGVATYWQLFRRRGGSVSVWEDEAALRRFVSLPFHAEIMRRYRTRGSLRALDWRAETFDLRTAFREGQQALDDGLPDADFPEGGFRGHARLRTLDAQRTDSTGQGTLGSEEEE